MKKTTLTLTLTTAIWLSGCFSTDNSESNSGIIPSAENFFYEIPSAVSAENPTEAIIDTEPSTLKRVSELEGDTSSNIFDAYKPVPAYIHLAAEAKNQVKAFIDEISTWEISEDYDEVHNGMRIRSRTIDTTLAGASQKLFAVNVTEEETEKSLLRMNYWKNARGQYRGNFYFTDRDPSSENQGAAIHVHFNGHNEGIYGKRMMVTFYQPKENLEDINDPSVVRVWTRKKGDRVFVTGASYHPNFVDEFWPEGAKVYAFRSVVNTEKDRAVLKVAFCDADSSGKDMFEKYPLDQVVVDRFVVQFQEELSQNDSMAMGVAWSIENEKDLPAMYAEIGAGTFVEPTLDVSVLTREQFLTFIRINREFLIAEGVKNNDPGMANLVRFIEMEQPVFLGKGGVFIGGEHHRKQMGEGSKGYGIEKDELGSTDLTDLDPSELAGFDPEVQEEPAEVEE